ncbi:MAG TPA: hypothetical protein VMH83_12295, partial [Candidatus Acidoferrum sp.]|nr:hypothetical protein [Candidatus Acidoferrum sp.]
CALLLYTVAPITFAQPKPQPNLAGVWMNDNTLDERMKREGRKRQTAEEIAPRAAAPEAVPLTAKYMALYNQMRADAAKQGEGVATCEWPGMPTIMTYPYPFEILMTPGRITLLFEVESQVRRIYMDRQQHLPEDELDPSYNGDSIGHFEGNTLVIDTVGFNTRRPVRNLPHSDKLHIVERLTLVDKDHLNDEITLTDAEAFTQPIVLKAEYSRRPDWRIREYSCEENNRDAPDGNGQRAGAVK